jgi:hypothetical protein
MAIAPTVPVLDAFFLLLGEVAICNGAPELSSPVLEVNMDEHVVDLGNSAAPVGFMLNLLANLED